MRFAIFPLHLSNVLRLPRKIDVRSYEVLHLSRKIILANLQIGCSKMQPLSGNQRPDLLTSLMNMSFVLRLHAKCILADPLQMSYDCHGFWKCDKTLTFCSLLARWTIPCACHAKRHLNLQKWRGHVMFCALTSKGAWRHNGVHFFDISTSKSGATPGCFVHCAFDMCFAPQLCALFRHLNFQKWSDTGVFCAFCLRNVLRTTAACTFSSLIWPDGSAPAALASLLSDSVSRPFYLFAHLHLLSDSFSSIIFSLLVFSSPCLCPALPFICPYCRKFDF